MLRSSEKGEAKQQTSRSTKQMAQLANCICLSQLGLLFDPNIPLKCWNFFKLQVTILLMSVNSALNFSKAKIKKK
jgi:hypothetical protein